MLRLSLHIAAVLAATAGAASAHHGWGSYDASKAFKISAPVEMVRWVNPHVHIMLHHDGAMWQATLAPLSRMERRGLSQELLKAGATVTAEGYPSTKTANEMRAERITVDGKTYEMR